MSKDILVIPDGHAHPEYDNKRWDYLGSFIRDTRPDAVVCLGDLWDMASLSSYDKGKGTAEGRRYSKDIDSGNDALDRIEAKIHRLRYSPRKLMTLGNHEQRIKRAVNQDPALIGTLSYDDFDLDDWGVVDYGEFAFYAGWVFTHCVLGGNGYAMGGKTLPARLVSTQHMSIVVGHSHYRGFAEDVRPDGKRVYGINAGCYAHPGQVEDWNRGSQHRYWNGVVMLRGCASGQASNIEFIDASRIEEEYK